MLISRQQMDEIRSSRIREKARRFFQVGEPSLEQKFSVWLDERRETRDRLEFPDRTKSSPSPPTS